MTAKNRITDVRFYEWVVQPLHKKYVILLTDCLVKKKILVLWATDESISK